MIWCVCGPGLMGVSMKIPNHEEHKERALTQIKAFLCALRDLCGEKSAGPIASFMLKGVHVAHES